MLIGVLSLGKLVSKALGDERLDPSELAAAAPEWSDIEEVLSYFDLGPADLGSH